jgi:hypothetical protein
VVVGKIGLEAKRLVESAPLISIDEFQVDGVNNKGTVNRASYPIHILNQIKRDKSSILRETFQHISKSWNKAESGLFRS